MLDLTQLVLDRKNVVDFFSSRGLTGVLWVSSPWASFKEACTNQTRDPIAEKRAFRLHSGVHLNIVFSLKKKHATHSLFNRLESSIT